MENTLEPINPIEDTPYGALIIQKDLVCSPTSLCTWSDEKPAVYCRLPQHTLSPQCQIVNKGIGLVGCYDEPTCGGMVRIGDTEQIFQQNPQYKSMIYQEEKRVGRRRRLQKKESIIVIVSLLGIVAVAGAVYFRFKMYQAHRRRKKTIKHQAGINRNPRRPTSRKILSGAGKTGRPGSK